MYVRTLYVAGRPLQVEILEAGSKSRFANNRARPALNDRVTLPVRPGRPRPADPVGSGSAGATGHARQMPYVAPTARRWPVQTPSRAPGNRRGRSGPSNGGRCKTGEAARSWSYAG